MKTNCRNNKIVIVDDILGGGATVQMLVDLLSVGPYASLPLCLYTEYDEGIAPHDFYKQFDRYHTGESI